MKKEYIMVRVTREEKTRIKKLAHKREMNVSEYIRWLVSVELKAESKNFKEG